MNQTLPLNEFRRIDCHSDRISNPEIFIRPREAEASARVLAIRETTKVSGRSRARSTQRFVLSSDVTPPGDSPLSGRAPGPRLLREGRSAV